VTGGSGSVKGARASATRAASAAAGAALIAFLLAALAGGAVAEQVIPGLGDAGVLTRWGLPLSRLVMDLSECVTVGTLLMAALLLPGEKGELGAEAVEYLRACSWMAAVWSVAAAVNLIFTLSDALGQPVGQVVGGNELSSYVGQLPQGTALMLVVLMTVVIALLSRTTTTSGAALGLLVLSFVALLPAPLTGHSATSPDHEVAVTGVALHVAAVVPWVGGLGLVGWYAMTGGDRLELVANRFSRMALVCYVLVGVSGVANAIVRLPALSALWESNYGRLMLVKALCFAFLGWLGHLHRSRTLPAVARRKPRAFMRLAAVEVAVMAGTVGVAVALAKTAPPAVDNGTETIARNLLGYDMPAPVSALRLLTLWRVDLFFGVLVAALGLAYAAGVVRLRRRGDSWPLGRTISWFVGLFTIVFVTMSGVATYSPILFSVHMGQHMVMAMLTPIFLVLAAPVTLALRALKSSPVKGDRGPREWLVIFLHSRVVKVISHPAVATIIFVGSTYALYFTPLFESLMRDHLGHIAMLSHFLLSGSLFYWVLIGVDPAPHKLPFVGRILVFFVTMPFHAFFGIALMQSSGIASGWYGELGRTWGPSISTDTHTGGAIAWAFGEIPTFIVLIALVFQWFLEDQRLTRRMERKADRAEANHEPDELSDYNAYLAGLNKRAEQAE
jgi:putative copper resistance protein D